MDSPRTVLIADDQYICRLVLGKMLKQDGHHVTLAASGIECIDLCRQKAFDYVFIDCFMPEMTGFEAAEHVNSIAQAKRHSTKIYLTSASDPQHLLGLGWPTHNIHGFVAKPVNRTEVLSLLD
jgi:CheY-like chemotaxis protein